MKLNRKTRALLNRRMLLRNLHAQLRYHLNRHAVWESRIQKHESGEDWMPDSLVETFRERMRYHDRKSDELLIQVARAEKPYRKSTVANRKTTPILSLLDILTCENDEVAA